MELKASYTSPSMELNYIVADYIVWMVDLACRRDYTLCSGNCLEHRQLLAEF